MSEKEKMFVELLSKMPDAAQDKFLQMAQGAAMMLDVKKEEPDKGGWKPE
jgi:hypothetical protein